MDKRKIGLLVLVWLLAAAWLSARQPSVTGASAALAHTRTHTWTFAASEFRWDGEGYLSPVGWAPFPFTAAGAHMKVAGIAGFFMGVELRLRADGGEWSPWYPLEGFNPEADGRLYGENLVAWPQAREVQVRASLPGLALADPVEPLSEALQDLTVVAIDAHGGPTTAQATLAARMRAMAGAVVAQGDPGVPQPTVVSRAEWGADESWMTWAPDYEPVEKIMLHHTVSGGGGDPAAQVRSIYYYHAVIRGWGDIGYNFIVDGSGNIYEGRYGGPDVIGAHVAYWNEGSMGVSVLGCYDNGACSTPQVPTSAALDALADLVAWASSRQKLDPRALQQFGNDYGYSPVTTYVLSGHRDYGSTVCPGGNLYAKLPDLRWMAWERLPEYDVRFGWHNTPSSLDAGQQVNIYPNLYNYGRLAWSDDGGIRLGYRWLQDGQVVAEDTVAARIIPGAVVNFGEMTALVAQLTAPTTPGMFTLRWDLYRDGVGWFADRSAPAGRSQPLDWTVEVAPALALEVQLSSGDVAGGDSLIVSVSLEGPVSRAFEAHTRLPQGVSYVAGSGQSTLGSLYSEPAGVRWVGAFGATPAQASFTLNVSAGLGRALVLSTMTTLDVVGYAPLALERRFIVNGYHSYLPLAGRAWTD